MDEQKTIQKPSHHVKISGIVVVVSILVITGLVGAYFIFQQTPQKIVDESGSQSSIDTSDWKTYRNDEYGFSIKYPTFGKPSAIDVEVYNDQITIVVIEIATGINEDDLRGQFSFSFIYNKDQLTPLGWFRENVDKGNLLLSSGAFIQDILSNGMSSFIHEGAIPVEHGNNYGPVSPFFALSPSENIVVNGTYVQDHDLTLLGLSTKSERMEYLRAIFESLRFDKNRVINL